MYSEQVAAATCHSTTAHENREEQNKTITSTNICHAHLLLVTEVQPNLTVKITTCMALTYFIRLISVILIPK